MAAQEKLDQLFIDVASRIAQMSHAVRSKVGAIVVKDGNIISMGWNGTPTGADNACEVEIDGQLVTKPEVLHAESNALMKLAAHGGFGAEGGTLYITHSPCPECAKLIKQSKVSRVVYQEQYRLTQGLDMLRNLGVQVDQLIFDQKGETK